MYKDEHEHMSYVGEKRRHTLKVIMWQNVGYEESNAEHGSRLEYQMMQTRLFTSF